MSYSLCLLTASCLAGAPPAPLPGVQPPVRVLTTHTVPAVPAPEAPPTRSWRLGDRLRGLFSRRGADEPVAETIRPVAAPAVAPQASGAYYRQPMPMTPAGVILSPQSGRPAPLPHMAKASPLDQFPVSDKELQKIGHEKDYSWITGKLFRAPGGGDRWVLRYGAPYEVERLGGLVLLLPHAELSKCQHGDLICVHGRLMEGGQVGRSGASASYQIQSISLIERGGK